MIFFKKAMYTLIENTTNTVKNTEEIKIQLRSHPQRKKNTIIILLNVLQTL